MRWLEGITDSMDTSLSKLQKMVKAQGSLVCCSPWGHKVSDMAEQLNWSKEMWVWPLGQEDPLEGAIATHSSILAWRIPWTEKSGKVQSIGSQRVGHDWSDWACTHAHTCINYLITACVSTVLGTGGKLCQRSYILLGKRLCDPCKWMPCGSQRREVSTR